MNEGETLHTVAQAAKRLNVSERTVRRMIDSKEITAYKVRDQWRIPESDIQRYLAEQSNLKQ
jgi:excisionase family DNA binding protein